MGNRTTRACVATLAWLLALGVAAPAAAATTAILKEIPYHPMSGASNTVKKECALHTAVPEAFEASLPDVKLVGKLGGGQRLELTIRDVHAPGGGMFSGPKWVRIDGTLKRGGKVIGSFRANRNTVTGSGTCGMLMRCVNAIADDVAGFVGFGLTGNSLYPEYVSHWHAHKDE